MRPGSRDAGRSALNLLPIVLKRRDNARARYIHISICICAPLKNSHGMGKT